ncbi:MAG: hypothetical protein F4089_13910 [Gammaproteobacteria bacterium]|nr:hypothetical protein [Gammaproteobacteria bacterium]
MVEELRKKLPFDGYSLKGKFSVAVKPDAEFSQSMGTATDGPRIVYNFKGGFKTNVNIEGGEERDTLRLRVERGGEPVLETTVGIRPGQTLVLGSVPRPEEATLLIVVRMVEG